MRFSGKCFAAAMSVLFAFTPVVPAGAMPLASAKIQATGGQGDVQLVRNNEWREGLDSRQFWPRRHGERGWRADRRDRHWRGDRGYRHGWYGGHRGYRYARPGYRHHNGYWFPLAAFATGAIIGGAIATQPAPRAGGINPRHYQWCANRYRSYDSYSNTFQPYNGPRQRCYSPYY